MAKRHSSYKPLPQSEQDAVLLQALALLSAFFSLIIFSISLYILANKIACFEAIVLMFYISALLAGFCYAALCIQAHVYPKKLQVIRVLEKQSICEKRDNSIYNSKNIELSLRR